MSRIAALLIAAGSLLAVSGCVDQSASARDGYYYRYANSWNGGYSYRYYPYRERYGQSYPHYKEGDLYLRPTDGKV